MEVAKNYNFTITEVCIDRHYTVLQDKMILVQRWYCLLCLHCNLSSWPSIVVDTCSISGAIDAITNKPFDYVHDEMEDIEHNNEHNTRITTFRHENVQVSAAFH